MKIFLFITFNLILNLVSPLHAQLSFAELQTAINEPKSNEFQGHLMSNNFVIVESKEGLSEIWAYNYSKELQSADIWIEIHYQNTNSINYFLFRTAGHPIHNKLVVEIEKNYNDPPPWTMKHHSENYYFKVYTVDDKRHIRVYSQLIGNSTSYTIEYYGGVE